MRFGSPSVTAAASIGPSQPAIVAACSPSRNKNFEDLVANIKSQIKRNRQNERRRLANKAVRSEMKTRTKVAVATAEAGSEDSVEALRLAVKRIDKAAASGVIHKNQAANRKRRLMRQINSISA